MRTRAVWALALASALFGASALVPTTGAQQASTTSPTAAPAAAPLDRLRAAIAATATTRTAHVALSQQTTVGAQVVPRTVVGTLAGGDYDLILREPTGDQHHVAVGSTIYQRSPDQAGRPWRQAPRHPAPVTLAPAPSGTSWPLAAELRGATSLLGPSTAQAASGRAAFGPLTLSDGTSLGDPSLYRSVSDGGADALPQGPAHKLVAQIDMAAVGRAMQLGASDQARIAQMQGSATTWVGDADGRITRDQLRLSAPAAGAGGPTTVDTTIDLSDLDAPISVQAPA